MISWLKYLSCIQFTVWIIAKDGYFVFEIWEWLELQIDLTKKWTFESSWSVNNVSNLKGVDLASCWSFTMMKKRMNITILPLNLSMLKSWESSTFVKLGSFLSSVTTIKRKNWTKLAALCKWISFKFTQFFPVSWRFSIILGLKLSPFPRTHDHSHREIIHFRSHLQTNFCKTEAELGWLILAIYGCV